MPTEADNEVLSWITEGTPPIYFGFGSMPIPFPTETAAVISAACAQLGERGLICSGWNDFTNIPHADHIKLARAVNHAVIFPACRAVVHHGGAGTTAAGMRAGTPTLILWFSIEDQPICSDAVTRLKVGSWRPFSASTPDSLVADLRSILTPQCAARAREVAAQMTKPAESVASAVDLLEDAVHLGALADRPGWTRLAKKFVVVAALCWSREPSLWAPQHRRPNRGEAWQVLYPEAGPWFRA